MSAPQSGPEVAMEEMDVGAYHRRSKHLMQRYARGPDTIDWERQPDPFRRFSDTLITRLPLVSTRPSDDVQQVARYPGLDRAMQPASQAGAALNLDSLGLWLQHSLALSAWKQYGNARWALRCNPSSGNLHPTEAYLLVSGVAGLEDGVYHYRPDCHGLEQRCRFRAPVSSTTSGAYIGLSSVAWREAWKYGERAYRYCQLDIGHALATLDLAASLNHWALRPITLADDELNRLLGTDRDEEFVVGEEEWAECLLQIKTGSEVDERGRDIDALLALAENGHWSGRAEVLDPRHFYDWPVINAIAGQVRRPHRLESEAGESEPPSDFDLSPLLPGHYHATIDQLLMQRRSAQAFDVSASMDQNSFFVLLDHLLPRTGVKPWMALAGSDAIHCVLFVHRVVGLAPGLYALPRSRSGGLLMQRQMRSQFAWQPVQSAPQHLPLYMLVGARAERAAARLSCQQAIAGDGVFSLAMLAEFSASIGVTPWRYRELYREAGVLGQLLYLEAEGIDFRGTGIGCFYDDAVHELLGIEGDELQSLYHFTVGRALHDPRIITLPPYGHRPTGEFTS